MLHNIQIYLLGYWMLPIFDNVIKQQNIMTLLSAYPIAFSLIILAVIALTVAMCKEMDKQEQNKY